MIEREDGCVYIQCDSCSDCFGGEPDEEFAAVWASAKDAGWHCWKAGSEWLHSCPDCMENVA